LAAALFYKVRVTVLLYLALDMYCSNDVLLWTKFDLN
jgi:hypothetical protein